MFMLTSSGIDSNVIDMATFLFVPKLNNLNIDLCRHVLQSIFCCVDHIPKISISDDLGQLLALFRIIGK